MISLKKFLSKDDEAEHTLSRAVQMLIEGISKHAPLGDPEVCLRFRESIQEISDVLSTVDNPKAVLAQVSSVVQALEDHSRRTARNHKLQIVELQSMMKMPVHGDRGVESQRRPRHSLERHRESITSASMLDDVRLMGQTLHLSG